MNMPAPARPVAADKSATKDRSMPKASEPQIDKFKEAARDLECDDDPERFRERLKKLVKHKPVEKSE